MQDKHYYEHNVHVEVSEEPKKYLEVSIYKSSVWDGYSSMFVRAAEQIVLL